MPQNAHQARTPTHIYVRDTAGSLHACWSDRSGIYCGTCLHGAIQPKVGEVCPSCSSRVERILEVSESGARGRVPGRKTGLPQGKLSARRASLGYHMDAGA